MKDGNVDGMNNPARILLQDRVGGHLEAVWSWATACTMPNKSELLFL